MSYEYYTQLWQDTAQALGDVVKQDAEVQKQSPFQKREPALRVVADLYVRYLNLVRNLDVCYDQMTQPQKRPLLRRLLEMAIARMLEMRFMLQQLDISDFSYFHTVLFEHGMTPFDLELPAPRYFRFGEPREGLIKELNDRIDQVLHSAEDKKAHEGEEKPEGEKKSQSAENKEEQSAEKKEEPNAEKKEEPNAEKKEEQTAEKKKEAKKSKTVTLGMEPRKSMAALARERQAELDRVKNLERQGIDPVTGKITRKGAIEMVQRQERARQARVAFGGKKADYRDRKRLEMGIKPQKVDIKKLQAAAIIIQKIWRGYNTRLMLRSRDTRMLLTLGMAMPSSFSDAQRRIADEVCAMRRKIQTANQKDYEKELALETTRWMKRKAPWLRDDLTDQIRQWFIDWYNKAGLFAPYPTEEEGGGMAIVDKKLVAPEKFLQRKERLEKEKELVEQAKKGVPEAQMDKKALKELKKKEKAEKKAAAKAMKQKMKAGERLSPWVLPDTDVFPELMEAYGEYKEFWRGRDETDDGGQRLEMDLLREEVAAKGTRAIRLQVDEFMRLELEVLNEALDRDSGKKSKKGGKKDKKGKKGKKSKEEPPLTEEAAWAIFDELVENGIIKKVPPKFIKEFRGDFSYMTEELRKALTTPDPLPGLGEIRQVVMESCILPLGCAMAHNFLPLVRSVCFVGMPRSGTSMLAQAVCTESGSLVFDFSPNAICHSPYIDGPGIKRFVKIVGDVARFFQPSVFLVDGAEKPFYKKIPPEEKDMKPKTAAKHIQMMLKTIKPEDQIMIVGATSNISNAAGPIKKIFDKWIFIPTPEYNSVVMTWNEELMKNYLVDREFFTGPLAMETMNYSMEQIINGANNVLNLKRQLRLKNEPLSAKELLTEMFKVEEYDEKDKKNLLKWYNQTVPTVKYKNKVLANERIAAGLDPPKKKKK